MLFETFIFNITTLALSFLTVAGLCIWQLEDDIYIYLYPHSYGFLWFLVILNLFLSISIIGLTIYKKSRMYIETQIYDLGKLVYVLFAPTTLVLSVCWLAIASSVTQITTECFKFKKVMENERDQSFRKFTCTGEIMISVFGFTLFIVYASLFLFNAMEIIKMLIENYKYNQHTKNEILQETRQEQAPQELQEISTRHSSLQRNTSS
jgi:hypothetical protein